MSEKGRKRIPPWEQAQLNFQLSERRRLRELEDKTRPSLQRLLDLEANRQRLLHIKKHICPNCRRYILSDNLPEGERKIGDRFGFCNCNSTAAK